MRRARMAVAVQLEFKGGTLEQYDQVIQKMGFRPGGPSAPGALFHWVTKTPDGIRVVDVWRSREGVEKVSGGQIVAFTREAGFTAPPERQVFQGHNLVT